MRSRFGPGHGHDRCKCPSSSGSPKHWDETERGPCAGDGVQVPVREAINQAIDEEMARDPNVYCIGAWGRLVRPILVLCRPK